MRQLIFLLVSALVMAGACMAASTEDVPVRQTWTVHVVNGLRNAMLFAHCKSKDDDLGMRNLAHGTEFNWTFDLNYWGTTLFWCYLRKPGADVSFEVFWVEKRHDWLSYRCADGNCIWTAKDDGIYLKNISENVDELIHKWITSTN